MKTEMTILKRIRPVLLVLLITGGLFSCKKDSPDEPDASSGEDEIVSPVDGTRSDLTKDSIFLYAKQIYYWNDALPSYEVFNPRKYKQYSDQLDNYYKELFDITQLKINPATGKPYEYVSSTANYPKYSYITDAESQNPTTSNSGTLPSVSQVTLEGVGTDFGIALSAVGTTSSYQIYIRYVSKGSPADRNSLSRGDVITEVNGTKLGANFASDQHTVNTAFDLPSIRISGKKPNGTTFARTLTKMTYFSSPVYKDTVITTGGKKIGYLSFARFSNPSNATGPLNEVFKRFSDNQLTELVIDLRYNGGGYVSTAEYLANLIAPSSLDGNVMFTEYFNQTMQRGEATILKKQPLLNDNGQPRYSNGKLVTYFDVDYSVAENTYKFDKIGALANVKNVVFIVTENTASASELVINVLKPYVNVKIVGEKSYGKPVGFFPITIDKYDIYYSMFESKNSKGEGGYYQGFTPDRATPDDVTHDFGDPQEASFAAAIQYLTSGSFPSTASVTTKILGKSVTLSSNTINQVSPEKSFKGMIEDGKRLKLKK